MPKILPATGGDVVEIILADHRWFEEALRELRDVNSDRSAVLADLATVLIAHAEAEESKVYPRCGRRTRSTPTRSSTPSTSTTRATRHCSS